MSARFPIGKMILLSLCGAALAFFGCMGALSGGNGAVLVGGTGFVAGLILLLVSLLRLVYYVLIWIIDRFAPPSPAPIAAPNPPAPADSSGPDGGEPPQPPQE
jgi:hypothetical protein